MIKVVIVDDEEAGRNIIKKFCSKYSNNDILILAECASVDEGVKAIEKFSPDLVFLDIQMPEKDGFQLLEMFEDIDFDIVFTTAFNEYALKAIQNNVLDYLLKPLKYNEFERAVFRFEKNNRERISYDRYKLLLENINNQFSDKKRIAIPSKKGVEVIQLNNILYVKSNGSNSDVYVLDDYIVTNKSLKEWQIELGDKFILIHRQHLVNKDYIKKMSYDEKSIILSSGVKLPNTLTKNEIINILNDKKID